MLLAVENGDVADEADKFAFCYLGDLGGDFLFFLFEFDEFYLDEFVVFQRKINRTN